MGDIADGGPLTGNAVLDAKGNRLGRIRGLTWDPERKSHDWVVVRPGWFRRNRAVPLRRAYRTEGGDLVIAHDADQVRSAPPLPSPRLDGSIRRQLQIHYGVPDPAQ